jgi:hypothetical protein
VLLISTTKITLKGLFSQVKNESLSGTEVRQTRKEHSPRCGSPARPPKGGPPLAGEDPKQVMTLKRSRTEARMADARREPPIGGGEGRLTLVLILPLAWEPLRSAFKKSVSHDSTQWGNCSRCTPGSHSQQAFQTFGSGLQRRSLPSSASGGRWVLRQ